VPLVRETSGEEERSCRTAGPESRLERVDHYLAGEMLRGDRQLSHGPGVADGLGQRNHHLGREGGESP
jgi:hypothetical protein